MAATLLSLILGVGFLSTVSAVCPEGYVDPGKTYSRCFKFSKERISWGLARTKCVNEGGDLMSIRSIHERLWLEATWKKHMGFGSYWTGLESQKRMGQWEWTDGTPYDPKLVNWWRPPLLRQQCTIINRAAFQAYSCNYNRHYACTRSKDVPVICPLGWTFRNNHCYKYMDIEKPWIQARLDCGYYGGELVDILTMADQTLVNMLVVKGGRNAWLGLRTYKNEGGVNNTDFVWVTGDYNTKLTYWAKDEPNIPSGQETNSCLQMLTKNETNNWAMDLCNVTKPYICKRKSGGCEPGWRLFKNHCFRFYTGDDEKAWPEAKKFCEAQNSALLTIKEVMRQLFVMRYLKIIEQSGSETMWLGAKYTQAEKELTWVTGDKVTYNNWRPEQPDYDKYRDNCLQMRTDNKDGLWEMNNNCYLSMAFTCYAPTGVSIIDPTPAPPEKTCDFEVSARENCEGGKDLVKQECEARGCCYDPTNRPNSDLPKCYQKKDRFICPPDWRLHGSSCYKYNEDDELGWVAARRACARFHGDLADIRNEETQIFTIKFHRDNAWIGLNDRSEEGKYVWLDEQYTANWTNWAPEQPDDNGGRRKNCVFAGEGGMWVDEDCSMPKNYICKIPATPMGVMPTTTPSPNASRCGDDTWIERPKTDWCYQVNRPEVTWFDARAACEDHGGYLSSITHISESSFLRVIAKSLGSLEVWVGLDGLQKQGMWRWVDQQPFLYFDWAKGEPAKTGECGAMLKSSTKWKTQKCTRTNSYICKKLVPGVSTTLYPQTTVTPAEGSRLDCPGGTYSFRGHCYSFVKKAVTWKDAQTACRKLGTGADLVTISEQRDQDFVFSKARELFGNASPHRVWIGLFDRAFGTRHFFWSDNSKITYTNWDAYEPNNHDEHCVDFWLEHGRWNDDNCKFKALGYVCRQPPVQLPVTPPGTVTPPGCPKGYNFGYMDSCYRLVHQDATWDGANNYCFNQGGYTLDILDEPEQRFVSAYLVTKEHDDYWLGLGRGEDDQWKWTSKKPLKYTNWDRHIGDDKCAAIRARDNNAGRWKDFDCNDVRPFICKTTNILRGTRVPRTTIAPSVRCQRGWRASGDYCYKSFASYRRDEKKTWMEARDFCSQIGADLASIHDSKANDAFYFLPGSRETWIGINSRDPQLGVVWSDGRAVEYTSWQPGEPNSHNNQEQCGVYRSYLRVNRTTYYRKKWSLNTCSVVRPFVCGLLRGRKSNPTPPPMTPPTSEGCGENWIRREDWCYFFDTKRFRAKMKTWQSARADCMAQGGDLASVHDPEENDFLTTVISKRITKGHVWLGLNELDLDGYKWSDKSAVTYLNWDRNQPNDENHAQRCVTFDIKSGFWRDDNCGNQLRYVCKKRPNTFTPRTTVPTPTVPGYCPNGGYGIGNKCMYIVHGDTATAKSWDDAQRACVSTHGRYATLASINSDQENSALAIFTETDKGRYWIGLNDKVRWRKWRWVDNSEYTYASWSPGQPSGSRVGRNRKACVEIWDGQWYSQDCSQTRGYICQIYKNPDIVVSTPSPVDSTGCPDNTFIKMGGNCYKVFNEVRRWSDARTACLAGNMELASIDTKRVNGLLALMGANAGIQGKFWIGFNDVKEPGVYTWSDRSLVLFTNWAPKQPIRPAGGGCVAEDTTKGGWYDTICEYALPYACKYTRTPAHTAPPEVVGSCPSNDWYPLGSYCYTFPGAKVYAKSYSRAQDWCKKEGGSLTSIHSSAVNKFISNFLLNERRDYNAWIGMVKKGDKFTWDDGSPVEYTNWAVGPARPTDNCVVMEKDTGRWRKTICGVSHMYVCRAMKDGIPTTTMAPSPPVTKPGPPQPCQYDPLGFARGDFCYRFITRMRVDADYAEYECKKLTGHLVSLHSQDENDFVRDLLSTRKQPPAADAWIGYKKTPGGLWMWQDRTSSGYKNWELGQPGQYHKCAVISSVTGRWSDRKCTEYSSFVCKFKSVPPLTASTLPTPKPTFAVDDCPGRKGAYQFGDYCYQVTMDDIKRQEHARQVCRVKGGELTSVHDLEITRYLLQLVSRDPTIEKQNLWIGLVRTQYLCEIKQSRRAMCGSSPNITRQQCLDLDCCYDTENKHTSNCYKPFVDPRGKFEWRWTDATRFNFVNWAKGYPTKLEKDGCVDFGFEDGKWKDVQCLEQRGYICRYPFGVQVPTTITVNQCPFRDDAILYGDYCYHVTTTTIINRAAARAQCQMLGGDLASIHDGETNKFVLYDLMRMDGEVDVWIGLEKSGGGNFNWSDTTEVSYTNWGPGEPSLKGECVKMVTVTGKWIEVSCADTNGFVCKYPVGQTPQTTTPAVKPTYAVEPCEGRTDAIAFGSHCYHINYNDAMSWTSANSRCQKLAPGGHFASLHSEDENKYILQDAIRRQSPQDLWIGALSGGKNWQWTDGTAMDYLNWAPGKPINMGSCSVMDKSTGRWKDANCYGLYVYVCKFPRAMTTVRPTIPGIPACPFRKNGYRLGDFCYQATTSDLQTQADARQGCRVRGGELVSLHNKPVMEFIKQIWTDEPGSKNNNLWIGLVRTRYSCTVDVSKRTKCPYTAADISRELCLDRDCCFDDETPGSPRCFQSDVDPRGKFEWKWTDTSPYDYKNWAAGFPSQLQQDGCVETDYTSGQWRDIMCNERRGYVCRFAIGFPIKTTISVEQCPFNVDAILLGDYCYHVVTSNVISRASARAQCRMNGGDLASIHDTEVNKVILYDLMGNNSQIDIWLGLERDNGTHVWSDGTRTGYTNWGPGEPKPKGECVAMVPVTGKWIEVSCDMKYGYACKYPMGQIPQTTTPAVKPTFAVERCPGRNDAIAYGSYCYHINNNDAMSWTSANMRCQNLAPGGHFASLHSEDENNYILQDVIRRRSSQDLWIGGLNMGKNWQWTDGTTMDFLNWSPDMPVDSGGSCSVMDKSTGKWTDANCFGLYFYVCKFPKGIVTTLKPTLPALAPCPFRDGAYMLGDFCFQATSSDLQIQSYARQSCRVRGGELASVHNKATMQFMQQVWTSDQASARNNMWIGLVRTRYSCTVDVSKRTKCPYTAADISRELCLDRDCCFDDETPGSPRCFQSESDPRGKYEWKWTDTTRYDYKNWAPGFPSQLQQDGCVETDYTSGQWRDIMCNERRGYICRYPMGIPVKTTIKVDPCPFNSEAVLLGDYCYQVVTKSIISRASARAQCQMKGGDLASIHDEGENKYVLQDLMKKDGPSDLWIGLEKKEGKWAWSDKSTTDYYNWGPGEPSLKGECVKMASVSGKWIEVTCSMTNGYVCKYPMGEPIRTTTPAMRPTFAVEPCPFREDAISFLDYCYSVTPNNLLSWASAQLMCQQFGAGADLLSLHDWMESDYILQEVIRKRSPNDLWIGAISLATNWRWSDVTMMDFLNWGPNLPTGTGQCSRMDKANGRWKDTDCLGVYGYVCKFPKGAVTPKPTYPVVPCPTRPDAFLYQGACYDISQDANLDQVTSRRVCLSRGGDLSSFHSKQEVDFVQYMANRKSEARTANLWIGLVRTDSNAPWTWLDSEPVDFTYWAGRGPTPDGNCADMDRGSGRWLNLECDKQRGYVCKYENVGGITFPSTTGMTTPKKCPIMGSEWWEHGRYCYYVSLTDRVSQNAASDYCKYGRTGGHLVSIHSPAENGFLFTLVRRSSTIGAANAWLGLQKIVYTTPPPCKTRKDGVRLGGFCLVLKVDSLISQVDARKHCQRMGGELTSVHGHEENEFILRQIINDRSFLKRNVWIGLERGGGQWQWTDGSSVDYTNWSPGRPLGGKCVDMDRSNGMWMDIDCDSYRGYSCKFSEDMPTSPMPTTPFIPPDKCSVKGARWWEQGNNCYLVSTKTNVIHSAAYYNCKYGDDGGNMVSIHSAKENQFILSLVNHEGAKTPTDIWIGMRKINMVWQWVDGSPMDYANWAPGHPLPSHGGFCAEMDRMNGMWRDIDCDSQRGYSCKYPEGKTSPRTTATTPMTTQRRTLPPWTQPTRYTRRVTSPSPATPIIGTVHPVTGLSVGATAGLVVGSLLAVTLIILIIIFIVTRVRAKKASSQPGPDHFSIPAFSFSNQVYDNDTTADVPGLRLEDIRGFGPGSTDSYS